VKPTTTTARLLVTLLAASTWLLLAGCQAADPTSREPLRLVVMDPLAEPFACRCAPPSAWHAYTPLADHLAEQLAIPVEISYGENLGEVVGRLGGPPAIIIGKTLTVQVQAAAAGLAVRPLASLSDHRGSTKLRGVFVVAAGAPATTLAELQGLRIALGPATSEEKHAAARAALEAVGITMPAAPPIIQRCPEAAVAVFRGEVDAAVISSYALPLLESGSFVPEGSLKVVGSTEPVRFLTLFAGPGLAGGQDERLLSALVTCRQRPPLLAALGSRDGFRPVECIRDANP
jgi:ABC-type phosphate/phosphonate transport system substrate-binding protein